MGNALFFIFNSCALVLPTGSEQYFSCFWFEPFLCVINGLFRMLLLPGPSLNPRSETIEFLTCEGRWSPTVPVASSGLCRSACANGCCPVGFAVAAVRGPFGWVSVWTFLAFQPHIASCWSCNPTASLLCTLSSPWPFVRTSSIAGVCSPGHEETSESLQTSRPGKEEQLRKRCSAPCLPQPYGAHCESAVSLLAPAWGCGSTLKQSSLCVIAPSVCKPAALSSVSPQPSTDLRCRAQDPLGESDPLLWPSIFSASFPCSSPQSPCSNTGAAWSSSSPWLPDHLLERHKPVA